MTKDEMRAGLLKAYELLAYGVPDPDLTNSVSAPKWMEECDAWLDKFAPSKLPKQDEPPACPHCREVYDIWAGIEGFVPKTAPEAYQQRIIDQMREAAAKGVGL